jgi:cell fate regulator YaaT (PSP1 superfamily)
MFDSPEWTGEFPPVSSKPAGDPIIGIRFQAVGKVYHYNASGFDNLKVGQWVVVDSARGRQMGQVATLKPPRSHGGPYKRIERLASGRDMAMRHYYEQRELEAMISCRAESAGLRLPIKIVRAEYSFDGQTLTFLFSSDQEERIEVGELRERMSHLYRARLEFRQISPREVAKILGGMGACGIEERCCSKFLTEFSPVSIKHAKEQNLSLNPHDITGMCGRLRCCLVYEFEQYVEAKSRLPKLKSIIGTPSGEGKVVELLHLRDSIKVRIGEGMDARELIFHREQVTPLEELRRLQEKAMTGTCDKHEGGGCDCGKKGPRTAPPANAPQPAETLEESGESFPEITSGNSPDDRREAGDASPRVRDPLRDAEIKVRQDKIKAKLQEKQQRRDDMRRQLKQKAQLRSQTPQSGTPPAAAAPGSPASEQRPDRRERPERGNRPNRPDSRPDRGDRSRRNEPGQNRPNQAQGAQGAQGGQQRRPLAKRRPDEPRRDGGQGNRTPPSNAAPPAAPSGDAAAE